MNSKLVIIIGVVAVIGIAGFVVTQTGSENNRAPSESEGIVATVYKSPACGCCGVWAAYMEGEGYDVATENVQDMSDVKTRLGVPYELESCHTAEIDGYVVEGHIPNEAIRKLLTEQPDIKGIGMAGMPSGSPGMPGPKNEDFVIYEITHDGQKGTIFMTI